MDRCSGSGGIADDPDVEPGGGDVDVDLELKLSRRYLYGVCECLLSVVARRHLHLGSQSQSMNLKHRCIWFIEQRIHTLRNAYKRNGVRLTMSDMGTKF
jgi:hypothetical protein